MGGAREFRKATFGGLLVGLAGACVGITPDGGQTGSSEVPDGPKVPPDQDGPVRFEPVKPTPIPGTPTPYVKDSGVPPAVVAVSGEALYAADPSYGVRRFRLVEPLEPEPAESLPLPGGAAWLTVVGESLVVLGAGVAEGEDFNIVPPTTVLRRGSAAGAGTELQLPETLTIPGWLRDAQVVDGDRLIVLTSVPGVWACAEPAEAPEPGMRITEVQLGEELELGTQRSYSIFDGFMSEPGAILLTEGSGPYNVQLVTLDGGLQDHAQVTVSSPSGRIADREFSKAGETWMFRHLTNQRLQYAAIDVGAAEPSNATFALPWASDTSYYETHAVNYERYTLFTRTTVGVNGEPPAELGPGVVVDWLAEGGPQVPFEIPAGWGQIRIAGELLVAEIDAGQQRFRLSAAGIETVGEPIGLDQPIPEVQPGEVVYSVAGRSPSLLVEPSRLVVVDLERGETTSHSATAAVDFRLAVVEDASISLSLDQSGVLEVEVRDSEMSWDTPLTHRAEELVTVGNAVLAVGLSPTNDCYPETQGQPADPACTDADRGGITVFELESGDEPAVRTTLLPAYDVDVPDGIEPPVVEWMELAHSQAQVGLVQHRGYVCRTSSECDILGVELGEHLGQRDETWLYPFDLDTATFGEAIQLPSRKPFDQVTTKGLVGDEQLRFMHFIGTSYNPDGVHVDSAIFKLLTVDGDEQSSITLDGYPLLVDSGEYVVTVRPTVPLGSDLQGVSSASISVLELYDGAAYRVDSLDLGDGLMAYAWAQDRGAVLLRSGEDCEESTTLVSLEYEGGQVRELGRLDVLGQEWSLDGLSDEKVVLSQGKSPVQFLEVTLTSDGPEVESDLVRAWKVPVAVSGERVLYGRY